MQQQLLVSIQLSHAKSYQMIPKLSKKQNYSMLQYFRGLDSRGWSVVLIPMYLANMKTLSI